jgi:hypothetical protein
MRVVFVCVVVIGVALVAHYGASAPRATVSNTFCGRVVSMRLCLQWL